MMFFCLGTHVRSYNSAERARVWQGRTQNASHASPIFFYGNVVFFFFVPGETETWTSPKKNIQLPSLLRGRYRLQRIKHFFYFRALESRLQFWRYWAVDCLFDPRLALFRYFLKFSVKMLGRIPYLLFIASYFFPKQRLFPFWIYSQHIHVLELGRLLDIPANHL